MDPLNLPTWLTGRHGSIIQSSFGVFFEYSNIPWFSWSMVGIGCTTWLVVFTAISPQMMTRVESKLFQADMFLFPFIKTYDIIAAISQADLNLQRFGLEKHGRMNHCTDVSHGIGFQYISNILRIKHCIFYYTVWCLVSVLLDSS